MNDDVPHIRIAYPPELPVSAHREEIIKAVRENQVTIVCGDTGSGKTTQIPKMLLELGYGRNGRRIACTQPRRIAAMTIAERVAEETSTPLGSLIGYQHRFAKCFSRDTRVKFMTDGVLLAETSADPLLRAYDAIIVDEAHERTLNVDFLLGILKRILSRRRDLKVVISSATIDITRFGAFFKAPSVTIPGRLFPVEIRYRPPSEDDDADLPRDVANAVATLPPKDDILVFLPGERDIRETAKQLTSGRLYDDDVIPLLASLPANEQQRAFRPSGKRKIVLATNVAETSLTIPGIRCVIDSGLARISRYIHRTRVQRLQIEPISQASANQRAGRCGRVAPGICVRLYSEEDFASREPFTPPEVLRTSLAGVILRMLDLRLGDISLFPFIEPPRPVMIREGLRELVELGAVAHSADTHETTLTQCGRKLARIPIEPRLAKMLLAASDNGVLKMAIPSIAAMSCDDPRRRPAEEREKAQQAHAQFKVKTSDFLGDLALWNWWEKQNAELSQSKLRTLCKKTYLSYPRMREWRELVRRITELCGQMKLSMAEAPEKEREDLFHRSLLTGLLSRIGKFDPEERDWRGAYGLRFAIHPSSVFKKEHPQWIIAGELVDTSRLFARNVAAIDPSWIESAAGELCRHHCHSPEWDARSGFVRATEQVTLNGLVIVPSRRCDYSRVNFAEARDIFIRRGIIDGPYPRPPSVLRKNLSLIADLKRLADKLRNAEIFSEDRIADFFQHAIPANIASAPALEKWLRRASQREIDSFVMKREDWIPSSTPSSDDFPDSIRIGDISFRLSYCNSPDNPDTDGITCTCRRANAAKLRQWRSDWLVPGALPEKLSWLISTLPSAQRRILFPISETVSGLMSYLKPGSTTLEEAVREALYAHWGIRVSPDVWKKQNLPTRFKVRFRIIDDSNRTLSSGRDLEEAIRTAGGDALPVKATAAKSKSATWTFGDIPESVTVKQAGWTLERFPALHDEGDGVTLKMYDRRETALSVHEGGVARLYLLAFGEKARIPFRSKRLPFTAALHLKEIGYADEALMADILAGAVNDALVRNLPPIRSEKAFADRLKQLGRNVAEVQAEISSLVNEVVIKAAEILSAADCDSRIPAKTLSAVKSQIAWLVFPGFPRFVPVETLKRYRKYLNAAEVRLARARTSPSSDMEKESRFAPFWQRYREVDKAKANARALAEYRWLCEEYRISIFAQELHTHEPVSPKRLDAKWAEVLP